MPDDAVQLVDKEGQPKTPGVDLPQESIESEVGKGNVSFAPGVAVPVLWNGQKWSVPESELEQAKANGATLDLPQTSAVAAAVAKGASTLTLGGSDWLAIEGRKALGDPKGAEYARKKLQAYEEQHPVASTLGGVAGALIPAFVPGGAEAEGARLGLGTEEAVRGVAEADSLLQGAEAAKATAAADAATGRSLGSNLLNAAKSLDPYTVIGRGAKAGGEAIERMFGSKTLGTAARWGLEGSTIGVAQAADEAEIGDYPMTAESFLLAAGEGAILGQAFGLVGTGVEKGLVAAGRLADRLSFSRLGGTAKQVRGAIERRGIEADGFRAQEEGILGPFAHAEGAYDKAEQVAHRDASTLDAVLEGAAGFKGVSADGAVKALDEALAKKIDAAKGVGINIEGPAARISQNFREKIGYRGAIEEPPMIPLDAEDQAYEAALAQEGLAPEGELAKNAPSRASIKARWGQLADQAGIGTKMERPLDPTKPAAKRMAQAAYTDIIRSTGKVPAVEYGAPSFFDKYVGDFNKGVAERNTLREQLRGQATVELQREYDKLVARYQEIKAGAVEEIVRQRAKREALITHLTRDRDGFNRDLRVPLRKLRDFRAGLDDVIPYNKALDSLSSAVVEMKKAARTVLERHVEAGMDAAAREAGSPELLGRYAHAKYRYGQIKDILARLENERGAEARRFGRPTRFGASGHLVTALGLTAIGHPVAGVTAGLAGAAARDFGPSLAAWALHKVTRLSQMKAMRQEIEVGVRKAVRKIAAGGGPTNFAAQRLSEMPPHQLRATAAEAMMAVDRWAKDPDQLIAKIAAMSPGLQLVAPNTVTAIDGTVRRKLTWLAMQIPTRLLTLQRAPGPHDLSDREARDFLQKAEVVADGRAAIDALSRGQLTPGQAQAAHVANPAVLAVYHATLMRAKTMGPIAADQNQLSLLAPMMGAGAPPGFTAALQATAKLGVSETAPQVGKGMTRVTGSGNSGNLMKISQATTMAPVSQLIEGGSAGRRGRKGASAGGM